MIRSRTVKVLHFVESSGGGVLSVIRDSIRTLQATHPGAFEFAVLYSKREETPSNLQELLTDVELIPLSVGRQFFSPRDIQLAWRVARVSKRFDVMHCHSSRAGFIGRIARVFGGRRALYSPHCYAFLSAEFSWFKRACVLAVEAILARTPGSVTIACGDSEMLLARRLGGRYSLVRNGFTPIGQRLEATKPIGPAIVVGVGRDSPQKDQAMFLRISKAFAKGSTVFMWVGPSTSSIGTGWVSREKSAELMERASIFLMTSRWEGLPVAGLEAMAAGLPLVVRDVTGARDLVIHGQNGYLFCNEEEAIGFVERLAEDPELRAEMGAASRKLLADKFSGSNYAALSEVYARS